MSTGVQKDKFFRQNVIGISSVEFLWGLGLPVVVESTFLQIFLKKLGASSFVIGLIPFFFFIGISVFALLGSYYTTGMAFKRNAVILLHLVSGCSLLFIGTSFFLFSEISQILISFFFFYAVFSVCVGMTLPVWLNFLVKIFPEDKSVVGLAFMLIAQNLGKLVGSLLIVRVVERYALSIESAAIVFLTVGLVFSLGSLFFFGTREMRADSRATESEKSSFYRYVIDSSRLLLSNKNYLTFLAADFDIYVIITVISFYANYATSHCGIEPAIAAGFFVAFIYTGAIAANIFLGTLDLLALKQKYIVSKISSVTGLALLVVICNMWGFFLVSFLIGLSRGTRMLAYAPSVKKLSGLQDSTSYFAIGPILTLPLATMLPLATGRFLDHFSFLQADAYRIVFAAGIFMILITLLFILKTDFEVEKMNVEHRTSNVQHRMK